MWTLLSYHLVTIYDGYMSSYQVCDKRLIRNTGIECVGV